MPNSGSYRGLAFLSLGFRPFFLLGALYSALSVALWVPQYYGELALSTQFLPADWHIHEMFFGFLAAIVTGFLFTAVPNWTGRPPIVGRPLLGLVVLWIAGRIAVTFSMHVGWLATLLLDVSFLSAVLIVTGVEIAASRKWSHLRILLPVSLLLIANIGFHLEAHVTGVSDVSRRLSLAAAIILIMIIGGRIVPSFSRNWLVTRLPGAMPAAFSRFDAVALATGIIALGFWTAEPDYALTGALLSAAAVMHVLRLARWGGLRTWPEPLLFILHVGYSFVPVGFAFLATGIFWSHVFPQTIGVHALGAGAIGSMTVAVMIRATLGHTGREVKAGPAAKLIFLSIIASVLARMAADIYPGIGDAALKAAGLGWLAAFMAFAFCYAPALLGRRA